MRQKEFRALAKQLLPDLPGWRLKGPLLLWPPVDHTLRGVCFEPSGFDKDGFYLTVFLLPLCVRRDYLIFNMGMRLGFSWSASDPRLLPKLLNALRQEAMPYLADAQTPNDVIRLIRSRWGDGHDPYVHQTIAYLLARYGNRRDAIQAMDQVIHVLALNSDLASDWGEKMASEARMLRSKLEEDPEAARRLLREWEEESRRNLKLEEFTSEALAREEEAKRAATGPRRS